MQLILAIWRSAASTYWHNIQMLRSFVTVIKPFPTLIIQSRLIIEINLYPLFLTKKKKEKIGTGPDLSLSLYLSVNRALQKQLETGSLTEER
jgi:hypothetical protein